MAIPNQTADPGNVFPSDTHRRVAGYLPGATLDEVEPSLPSEIQERIDADYVTEVPSEAALLGVLNELEAQGDAERDKSGFWKLTQQGYDKLNGPALTHPIRDEETNEVVRYEEPPPMTGAKLKAAKDSNKALAEADREIEIQEAEKVKKELEEQILDIDKNLKELSK